VQKRILKKGAIPSQFAWKQKPSSASSARSLRSVKRSSNVACNGDANMSMEVEDLSAQLSLSDMEFMAEVEINTENTLAQNEFKNTCLSVHASVQTENFFTTSQTQTIDNSHHFSVSKFVFDDAGMQFYTGLLNYQSFCEVFCSLGPASFHLNYLYDKNPALNIHDQFFLVLIKCRTYKPNFELSRMFNISETEVYIIFVTWVKFMSLQWREVNLWPNRETVDFFAPFDFKQKFPTTRVIIDGTEIPLKKPKAPGSQQITFSTYKNRNTAKTLIGITPGGLVSFVSDAFGGSTSDRQITERSRLTEMVEPGDSIMADKGFDVQDMFAPVDVAINIPTFFSKRNKIATKTLMRDRKIASKRVHVERVIGLAKTYKILTNPLNQTEAVLAGDINFICFMLVNFRRCIVSHTA
jgi:DDE superfamily endonuclease/Helix-turn-helix of DDE superfamily endonuclease